MLHIKREDYAFDGMFTVDETIHIDIEDRIAMPMHYHFKIREIDIDSVIFKWRD